MRRTRPFFPLLVFALAVCASRADPLVHVLQKGETVYGIARKYSVPYEAILAANGITDPRKVMPGTRLTIPSSHKVEKGETLYGIARAYGVALADLMKVNNLSSGSVIKPGDLLVIPGGSPPVVAAQPVPPSPAPVLPAPTPSAVPTVKPPLKIPSGGSWPALGEAVYLDGKLFGVGIRTEENAQIRAVRAGTVISAGPFRGYGRVAFVQARDGLVYVYGGAQTLGVRIGESVRSGAEIGRVGIDLKEGRPVAYFLVFKQGNPLDPATVPRD